MVPQVIVVHNSHMLFSLLMELMEMFKSIKR